MTKSRRRDGRPRPSKPEHSSAAACGPSKSGLATTLPKLPNQRVTASAWRRTTIGAVKAYKIQRIKSGMKFTCTQCAHSVSTLDFDAKGGNLRTQAATAINEHARKAHSAPMIISPSDSQQRTWR
jgi:hypothetical protein